MHDFVSRITTQGASALMCLALLATGCTTRDSSAEDAPLGVSWSPESVVEVKGATVEVLVPAIKQRVEQGPGDIAAGSAQWARVSSLYEAYGNVPLWLERRGVGRRAQALIESLESAHEQALRPEAYGIEELRAAVSAVDRTRRPSPEQIAEADVRLTAAYAAYGSHLLTGHITPRTVNPDWRIDSRTVDVDSVLAYTVTLEPMRRALAELGPRDEGYVLLQRELVRYREILSAGGWGRVPEGESLKPGDTTSLARLQALRDRLHTEGYLAADVQVERVATSAERGVYDRRVAGAVAQFQERHAIVVDSILGPGTVTSLNVPAEYRLGQIAGNLERFRWLPNDLGGRYIFVNVPAFRLDAYDGGRKVLDMRVIVGAEYNDQATPAFADSMSYLEFAPYWNVPENIANEEIWPKVRADPGYLERNKYELVNDAAGTRIRQTPGKHNALGLVKFMFPNQYNIYLHHTPQEELFSRDIRALSHGCIRVEKPVELAEYVLAPQGGWDGGSIRTAMEANNRRVDLQQKLPVYIVYFTAYVRDGELYFGNDVYDRDGPLVEAVRAAAMGPVKVERGG